MLSGTKSRAYKPRVCEISGLEGRAIRAADRLCVETLAGVDVSAGSHSRAVARSAAWHHSRRARSATRLLQRRANLGVPKRGPGSVSTKFDRMAFFLDGPQLTHARGYNIVSDGIPMGAIQVPGKGQPSSAHRRLSEDCQRNWSRPWTIGANSGWHEI
ncbi:hypothetical protein ACF1BQ_030775 [Bradyrhizobium sp. RDT10]